MMIIVKTRWILISFYVYHLPISVIVRQRLYELLLKSAA
jgi:hypothetical protein